MSDTRTDSPEARRFRAAPQRTFVGLAIPVLVALVAEPLTGLVDTALVGKLGSTAQAALGVGTILLSSVFWVFNFLATSAQTEVAHGLGAGSPKRARRFASLALAVAAACGLAMTGVGFFAADLAATALGASGEVHDSAVLYVHIRFLGAAPVLVTTAAFGALRGKQDMRTPLWIALVVNALNIVLDLLLIGGAGPIPGFGIAGAAWASVASQAVGALLGCVALARQLGIVRQLRWGEARELLRVGFDIFARTALLTGFLLLTTRGATLLGADAGAAHQATRQVWLFAALAMDAFAAAAQSLVGYFLGAGERDTARSVARIACGWSLATGFVLTAGMLAATQLVADMLVPESARAAFAGAWWVAAVTQPLNAVAFATDGIHWGTRDYRYQRNSMLFASAVGAALLLALERAPDATLTQVWWLTGLWIAVRSVLGIVRIWPGLGRAPLGERG